jgi:hypothetical protein
MHLGSEVWIRGPLSKYQGSSIAVFRIHDILGWRLHHFSKIKSQEESQNGRNHGFSYYFCLMIEGSGVGSIPRTSGPYQLRFLHSASHPLLLPPFLPFLLPSFHLNPNSGWKIVWSKCSPRWNEGRRNEQKGKRGSGLEIVCLGVKIIGSYCESSMPGVSENNGRSMMW